jgi:hypothetical protein
MNEWLDQLIVSALIIGALVYITLAVIKKFKPSACGDDCVCSAKKTRGRRR